MTRPSLTAFARATTVLLALCSALVACKNVTAVQTSALVATVADIQAVHRTVTVRAIGGASRSVSGLARVGTGDSVSTNEHGRARLQMDGGALLVLDRESEVELSASGTHLKRGRLFVEGPAHTQTKVTLGQLSTVVAGASVSLQQAGSTGSVYCAQGEIVLVRGAQQTHVGGGETAHLRADTVEVVPEVAFDDWTGGLAVPWTNEVGSRSAIAELRAVASNADPGSPLVLRSHDVRVTLSGEVAVTKSFSTYFNGGSETPNVRAQLYIPNGAILTRVARHTPGSTEAKVVIVDGPSVTERAESQGLEWAGDGYLSGSLGPLGGGQVMSLELEYVEWLPRGYGGEGHGTRTYRYPMSTNPTLPPVGTLSFNLDATHTPARWVSASTGAAIDTQTPSRLTFRQSDVHPTGDFVAEVTHKTTSAVRAYVQGRLSAGTDPTSAADAPYVLLRADLPEQTEGGLTLALVFDTSRSAGGAAFETARAVVDALLYGLSPDDEIVVFASDQSAHPLGEAEPRAITPELREHLRGEISKLHAGGASNLEAALHAAADALDAPSRGEKAGTGVVVYVGDGRPTLGISDIAQLRRSLLRRNSGSPRLSAIAVGANADKWALARLTTGSGEVYEALDHVDASRVGSRLLASALQPTWRDVELELGTTFDRIYPRNPHSVIQGATVSVVARQRAELPTQVGLRFRQGATATTTALPLEPVGAPDFADVSRRWALARVEDIASTDNALEPAIALAAEAQLLTPWTGWFFTPPPSGKGARRFGERILTMSTSNDAAYGNFIDPVLAPGTMLLDRDPAPPRVSLESAAELAIRRVLRQASSQIRTCRQTRVGASSDLGTQFSVTLTVDAKGQTTRVLVSTHDAPRRDRIVERCIESVVRGLPQVATGVSVNLTHLFTVPDTAATQPTKCSDVSRISLPLRQSVWRARPASVMGYLGALRSCELPRWRDKRAYLNLLLENGYAVVGQLAAAGELAEAGQADAAEYMRREALRRVTDFAQLHSLPSTLLDDEPALPTEFDQGYARATSDGQRLDVVRRYLAIAPHNAVLRRRLLYLLELLGQREELLSLIRTVRDEAVVDAGLLAASASSLRRLGLSDEGTRVFGELLERAPGDPWTLAYVGDQLRAEGLYSDAVLAYEQLARGIPDDAGVGLRLALAHAGAGRLDVATRLLQRVAATGGRDDNGRLGELSAIVQAALLANVLDAMPNGSAELVRRLEQTPLPDVAGVVLVDSPPSDNPVRLQLTYEKDDKARHAPNFDASPLGLNAALLERGTSKVTLHLSRTATGDPVHPKPSHVYLLTSRPGGPPKLQKREVLVDNVTPLTLTVLGGQLQ